MDKALEQTPSRPEGPWPGPERVERLLDGAPAAPGSPGETRLADLLRTLTAAAGREPLDPAREGVALSAFRRAAAARAARTARSAPTAPARARLRRPAWPARALTGGLAAACALGVFTIAAGAGLLPGPLGGGAAVHAGPATPAPGGGDRTVAPPGTDLSVPDGGAGSRDPLGTARATTAPPPVAAPRSLCRSYERAVRLGRRPDGRLAGRLRDLAGGGDRVRAYCRQFADPHAPRRDRPRDRRAPADGPHAGSEHADRTNPYPGPTRRTHPHRRHPHRRQPRPE